MDIVIPDSVSASLGLSDGPSPKGEAQAEVKPDAKAEVKPEAKTPEPPKNLTPAEKKIWKLKVDGQEFDFDASDEEAVKREVTKARGANKKFEEAAHMRKQAEQFLYQLQTDPKSILLNPKLGVDMRKVAEEIVWESMQEASLTPEQKRQRDVDAELKKYKDAEAKTRADEEAREAKELQDHYEVDYNNKILEALKQGGVPNTKSTVRRMANYLALAIKNNLDLTPADLIAQVRRDYQEEHREMYASADGDFLLSMVGEGLAKKIRESDVKRLKTTQPEAHRKPTGKNEPRAEKAPKKLQGEDWREALERKMLGK